MEKAKTKPRGSRLYWMCLPFVIVGMILAIGCGILAISMSTWQDAKDLAQLTLIECLDGNREYCGYVIEFPCWQELKQAVAQSDERYSIEVLWYNLEDEVCCRGGDEVYMQVNVADEAYRILWYEGILEYCEAVE